MDFAISLECLDKPHENCGGFCTAGSSTGDYGCGRSARNEVVVIRPKFGILCPAAYVVGIRKVIQICTR